MHCLYCDIGAGLRQSVLQYTVYIVTEAGLKANGNCMAIHKVVLWPKGVGLLGTVS